MGSQNIGNHSIEKWPEEIQMFMIVDFVMEMTVKKPSLGNMDGLSICSFGYYYHHVINTNVSLFMCSIPRCSSVFV